MEVASSAGWKWCIISTISSTEKERAMLPGSPSVVGGFSGSIDKQAQQVGGLESTLRPQPPQHHPCN